ncbi:MAG: succinate dehydrogenase, cytochrome b556 subunit [Gammaproteobacteria bacterium]|jgi:succinate dehydrogenase / fumarate reductase, cytochrome b subunit|nr:succinate dehydrogenase, cytochrome b556 subunit [Gammaproteobacteria bacterium]NBP08066.1 succinate dehydrogenase, cytochrome b556 subunit [Gammaproteobacteria bacterium]NBR16387.1 succinate dehydrogenase, cytochrome b556 subunit [Gammaproteobacteria bacterium]NCW21927.1 succinate dehydrogenase, cytochrome b556 subunit [Gammaproteobacteria bacterium]NCW57142.1 succinate dehydrogenase, cytochrome b556 subunit [Gammaproteobacteria bacterium]
MPQRPLSPHLGIYRFAYTMATSIAHRASGIVLSVGFLLLGWWLMAAAGDEADYALVVAVIGSGFGKLLLAGWLIAFCYHLCNGLRHLNWDLGRGLEKVEARRSATVVVVVSAALALAVVYAAFFAGVPR